MILSALNNLYDRISEDPAYGLAPDGYSLQKISFKVVLRADGSLFGFQAVDSKQQTRVLGEGKPPGSGINPCFLWDNQTFLLGRQPEDKKAGFGADRFAAFKKRHLEVETAVGSAVFSAVCRFLESWQPESITEHPELVGFGTGFGVFQIQGAIGYVHEDPKVSAWWETNRPKTGSEVLGQCLVTGELNTPLARLHPKIKGVTNAQSSGASIVSFNAKAYESYGKEQSFNSPVGADTARRYAAALNALLNGPMAPRHRLRIGDATCVYWTDGPSKTVSVLGEFFSSGSQAAETAQDEATRQGLQRLLEAVRSGGKSAVAADELQTQFYILSLAPNAARLSVRFFHQSTVGALLERLHQHHEAIQIVKQFEKPVGKRPPDPEFPPLWQILRETARSSDEIPPLLGGALTRAIVEGTPYPEGLFSAIIRRIHADRQIPYLRAAALKALLTRNHNQKLTLMLDETQTDPAYRLGRLFAALEKTQEDAQPDIKATIRDRFYSAVSATPASVFPRLLRMYQHHLPKLKTGAKINREKLVQEILDPLPSDGLPNQLTLHEQGRFALGYYQQRKDLFTSKQTNEKEIEA